MLPLSGWGARPPEERGLRAALRHSQRERAGMLWGTGKRLGKETPAPKIGRWGHCRKAGGLTEKGSDNVGQCNGEPSGRRKKNLRRERGEGEGEKEKKKREKEGGSPHGQEERGTPFT